MSPRARESNGRGAVAIVILDGWGVAPSGEGNAVSEASPDFFYFLVDEFPATSLRLKNGLSVGFNRDKISPEETYQIIGTGRAPETLGRSQVSLSKIFSENNFKQLKIGETETFSYLTYYFNGLYADTYQEEKQILIPSQAISSYAKAPLMSASAITSEVMEAVLSDTYDVIVASFANADFVAHTGNIKATMKAVQYLDEQLKKITDAILTKRGTLIITSSHGNAENMIDMRTADINNSHTDNNVPFVVVSEFLRGKSAGFPEVPGGDLSAVRPAGTLFDVAPTVLKLMGLEAPREMNGKPLL